MISPEMAALVALLGRAGPASAALAAVSARSCAQVLGVSGIAVTVLPERAGGELLWHADETSTALDDLQFSLGQGPSVDAARFGEVVLEPELERVVFRWPLFVPAATELGVAAVFAFPLHVGAIGLGVMLAHRRAPGPLSQDGLRDALAFADAVTAMLLQPIDGSAEPGWLAERPQADRAEVHQATGMISVQLGVDLAEALVRLRAYAYGQSRSVTAVAADVVARRLRFDERLLW